MKFKNDDEFIDYFMDYVWFKNKERSSEYSVNDIGSEFEKLSWVYDIIINLLRALIKKKILTSKDLNKIFWRKNEKD